MTDLGALDGVTSGAFGINDSDLIVGESSSTDGTNHAVLWQGMAISDLGSFVGPNSFADAVNNNGQIAGQGTFGSFTHGFLLSPAVATPPPANPPVTTASLHGKHRNSSGWYTGPVTVTLTATDTGGPGVASTFYTIDGGAQQTYSGPFKITGDGTHTLSFWSVDTSGSAETPNTMSVMIDTTPPVTTDQISGNLTNSGWYTGTVTITLSATDAISGVARTNAVLDFWRYYPNGGPITVSTTGYHVLFFWSVDNAGNEECPHFVVFKIDNTAPQIEANGAAKSLGNGNWLITVSGFATDCGSGLASPLPTFSVSDNSGTVTPTNVSNVRGTHPGCFVIQFNAFLPSTVPPPSTGTSSTSGTSGKGGKCQTGTGSGSSGSSGSTGTRGGSSPTGHDKVSILLQTSDNVGNQGSKTVCISM